MDMRWTDQKKHQGNTTSDRRSHSSPPSTTKGTPACLASGSTPTTIMWYAISTTEVCELNTWKGNIFHLRITCSTAEVLYCESYGSSPQFEIWMVLRDAQHPRAVAVPYLEDLWRALSPSFLQNGCLPSMQHPSGCVELGQMNISH